MNDADPPGIYLINFDLAAAGPVATCGRLRFRLRILSKDVWPGFVLDLDLAAELTAHRVAVEAHGRWHLGIAYCAAKLSFLFVTSCLIHNPGRFVECEDFLFCDEFLHVVAEFLTDCLFVCVGSPAHFEVMLRLEVLSNFPLVVIPTPFML